MIFGSVSIPWDITHALKPLTWLFMVSTSPKIHHVSSYIKIPIWLTIIAQRKVPLSMKSQVKQHFDSLSITNQYTRNNQVKEIWLAEKR